MHQSKIKQLVTVLSLMAAASMPLSADQILRKDGHEITCRAVANAVGPIQLFGIFPWHIYELTLMHGSHLVYFCEGLTKKVPCRNGKKYTECDILTGDYICQKEDGGLDAWDYPTEFSQYLPVRHPQAETQVCRDFVEKHLKLK